MGKIRLFITFTFVSLWVFQVSRIDATVNYANKYCYNIKGNYTENSVYQQNLNKLFSQLSLKTPYKKFYNSTLGNVPNKVYVLYQCRADLSLKVCNECIESATKMIHEKCPFYKEAVIWYFECMLRYANRSILYGSSETLPRTRTYDTNRKVSDYGKFGPVLKSTMDMVISKAASSTALGHFGTGEANWTLFEKVYCMAQCTPDISEVGCKNCLISSLSRMSSCCNFSITVMLFTPSCQLRYDTDQKFYLDTPNNVLNTNSNVHPGNFPSLMFDLSFFSVFSIITPNVSCL